MLSAAQRCHAVCTEQTERVTTSVIISKFVMGTVDVRTTYVHLHHYVLTSVKTEQA
jgi:hypothetical protein